MDNETLRYWLEVTIYYLVAFIVTIILITAFPCKHSHAHSTPKTTLKELVEIDTPKVIPNCTTKELAKQWCFYNGSCCDIYNIFLKKKK